jgi:uncharacterized membrane protein YhhN
MTYFTILTVVCVVVLLDRERRGDRFGQAILKLMASTSFVGCALAAGATNSAFGQWVLAGLVFSWVGDACLLSRERTPFLTGLVSFLLAHLSYGGAFLALGVSRGSVLMAVVALVVVGSAVAIWLLPRVESGMRVPVLTYLVAISLMVALGYGAMSAALARGVPAPISALLLIAPLAFYLSDLAVARDRFVSPGLVNRICGLPLYYAAQILFAVSIDLL